MTRPAVMALVLIGLLVGGTKMVSADEVGFILTGGDFTTIVYPGASDTVLSGINDSDEVVGWYNLATSSGGFLYSGGAFTTIAYPGAISTLPLGINGSGQIVGRYSTATGHFGFLDVGGVFSTIAYPGASDTRALGINDSGQVVGEYEYQDGIPHGFVYAGGVFTTLTYAPGTPTIPYGINASGQIAGAYFAPGATSFLYTGGVFSPIVYPGTTAEDTDALGVNDVDQVVGDYLIGEETLGFLDTGGVFTNFAYPYAQFTFASGINDRGQIVGQASGLPEPSSWLELFVCGGGAILVLSIVVGYRSRHEASWPFSRRAWRRVFDRSTPASPPAEPTHPHSRKRERDGAEVVRRGDSA